MGDQAMSKRPKHTRLAWILVSALAAWTSEPSALSTAAVLPRESPIPTAFIPAQSSACPATPFETRPFPEPGLEAMPWVKAEPATSQIVAYLYPVPDKPPETQ